MCISVQSDDGQRGLRNEEENHMACGNADKVCYICSSFEYNHISCRETPHVDTLMMIQWQVCLCKGGGKCNKKENRYTIIMMI